MVDPYGTPVTIEQRELFNSGVIVDRWACDFNPELMKTESNGGQEFVISDEYGNQHIFVCNWSDEPILYLGLNSGN